jgi:hypothetical protein
MIAASLLLAACLMQAEPAPAQPIAPVPPPAADPGPAEAAPPEAPFFPKANGPGAPPPPSAPGPAAPRSAPEAPRPPIATVSIFGGLGSRIGTDASRLGPSVGFSFGASLQRRYALLKPEVELGLAADFLYYRFSSSVPDRTISETTFGLVQTLGVRTGATYLWFGAGAGLAVGYFSTSATDISPATASARQPFARVVGGADMAINDQASVGFRAGYMSLLTTGAQTTGIANPVRLFVDLLDIQVGLFYRFR